VAKATVQRTFGVDVAKDELVIHEWETGETCRLENTPAAIADWLRSWSGAGRLAVEPTSNYHLDVIDLAQAHGVLVYLVNPRQLVHYRESVNLRHKSDPEDAWLLARFLYQEGAELRPFTPASQQARRLWALLKRRATVVEARQQLRQSLTDVQLPHQALMTQFKHLLARLDQRIQQLIGQLGWERDYRRCQSIPGVGPLNAAALVCAYHRGAFASSDAFIAYLGLDIRRRDSGRYKGQRKLTKRGDAQLRRLLYCATQAARSLPRFDHYYRLQLEKGLPRTACKIALARKLARIAYTLLANQQSFRADLGTTGQTP
jgi:transposase